MASKRSGSPRLTTRGAKRAKTGDRNRDEEEEETERRLARWNSLVDLNPAFFAQVLDREDPLQGYSYAACVGQSYMTDDAQLINSVAIACDIPPVLANLILGYTDFFPLQFFLGTLAERENKWNEAWKHYSLAEHQAPQHSDSKIRCAHILMFGYGATQVDWVRAEHHLVSALRLGNNDAAVLLMLLRIHQLCEEGPNLFDALVGLVHRPFDPQLRGPYDVLRAVVLRTFTRCEQSTDPGIVDKVVNFAKTRANPVLLRWAWRFAESHEGKTSQDAEDCLQMAAAFGHAEAIMDLVRRDYEKKDNGEIKLWLNTLVSAKYPPGMLAAAAHARVLQPPDGGQLEEWKQAFELAKAATTQGHYRGWTFISLMYLTRNLVTTREDIEMAFEFSTKAAGTGCVWSAHFLATDPLQPTWMQNINLSKQQQRFSLNTFVEQQPRVADNRWTKWLHKIEADERTRGERG